TSIALLRAEAADAQLPMQFLESARDAVTAAGTASVTAWGPVPATMERRAGRFRAQLLLQSARRGDLQRLLSTLVLQLEADRHARRVRWSIDVDPAELF
ncbi:MAG: primosomal protein N', partial [Gammaproteobacteria bacterium]